MGGNRILLVEDEYLVGINIQYTLTDAGFEVIGPAMNIKHALQFIETEDIDAAVLDVNLGGQYNGQIASKLKDLKIPFLLLTGYGRENLPREIKDAPLVEKPFDGQQLIETVRKLHKKFRNNP